MGAGADSAHRHGVVHWRLRHGVLPGGGDLCVRHLLAAGPSVPHSVLPAAAVDVHPSHGSRLPRCDGRSCSCVAFVDRWNCSHGGPSYPWPRPLWPVADGTQRPQGAAHFVTVSHCRCRRCRRCRRWHGGLPSSAARCRRFGSPCRRLWRRSAGPSAPPPTADRHPPRIADSISGGRSSRRCSAD